MSSNQTLAQLLCEDHKLQCTTKLHTHICHGVIEHTTIRMMDFTSGNIMARQKRLQYWLRGSGERYVYRKITGTWKKRISRGERTLVS